MAIVEILDEIDGVKYPPIDLSQKNAIGDNGNIGNKTTREAINDLPSDSGIFWIRKKPDKIDPKVKPGIIQVFYGSNRCDISVTCSNPGEILYIGKSTNIKGRVRQIFSLDKKYNLVARKLVAIFNKPHNQPEAKDMTTQLLDDIKPRIMFEYLLESHPIKREFLKTLAVSIDRPCLNIGLEH